MEDHPGLSPGRYVCLSVEDHGRGMDEETRRRVFEPFFTTKFQGRGLGMPAVYGIVRNHQGCVSVESALGKGTIVRIYLPAGEAAQFREEVVQDAAVPPSGTILIVEDEEMIMEVSRALLKRMGYHVLTANTGTEAVRIAATFKGDIDLVILDVILPDMGGKETYQALIQDRPSLRVLVCSGYSIEGPAQEIMDAGADGFLQKPFSLDVLTETLKALLQKT